MEREEKWQSHDWHWIGKIIMSSTKEMTKSLLHSLISLLHSLISHLVLHILLSK